MHQYQDWFSHWQEGYQLEHVRHSDVPISGKNRPLHIINNFYNGTSPVGYLPATGGHPKEEVTRFVKNLNPGLNVSSLNDNELIDLYLRRYGISSDAQRYALRFETRFYTDRYIPGSTRDLDMEMGTKRHIVNFLLRNNDACEIDWDIPSDAEVKAFLLN